MEVFCNLHQHLTTLPEIMHKLPISGENKSKLIDYLILLKLLMEKKNMYFPNNFYIWWVSYLLPIIDYRLYKNIGYGNCYRKIDINSFVNAYNIKYKLFSIFNNKYSQTDNIYCEIFSNRIVNNNCIKNLDNYHVILGIDEKSPILYIDYILQIKINFIHKKYFYFSEIIDTFVFEIPILETSFHELGFDLFSIYYSKKLSQYILKKYKSDNSKINEYIKNHRFFLNEINNFSPEEKRFPNKNKELLLFDKFNNNLFNNFYPIINNDYIFSSPMKKLIYLDLYKKVINRDYLI